EFFMKRVGNLKSRIAIQADNLTGADCYGRLQCIRQVVQSLLDIQASTWTSSVLPELKKHGVHLLTWSDLSEAQKHAASQFFRQALSPILTPLPVDPGHPFPFMSNLSTSLGILLQHPDTGERLFARVKVPETLQGLVALPDNRQDGVPRQCFLRLSELIRHHL